MAWIVEKYSRDVFDIMDFTVRTIRKLQLGGATPAQSEAP